MHRNKKWHFGILRSNRFRNTHFLSENVNSEVWPYMARGWWPFSVVDLHEVRLQKTASIFEFYVQKWPLVPYARKKLILVTIRDLSWPDLDPDPYLVWHLCSQGIFNSPFRLLWLSSEQKLSILPSLGFIIQTRQNLTFCLTLTRDLRSILKSDIFFGKTSLRALERRLAGLDTTIGSRDSRVAPPPTPTPGGRSYENSPVGAGLSSGPAFPQ